jgi:hypothetical protein
MWKSKGNDDNKYQTFHHILICLGDFPCAIHVTIILRKSSINDDAVSIHRYITITMKALDKDYEAYCQRVHHFKEKLKWDVVAAQHA